MIREALLAASIEAGSTTPVRSGWINIADISRRLSLQLITGAGLQGQWLFEASDASEPWNDEAPDDVTSAFVGPDGQPPQPVTGASSQYVQQGSAPVWATFFRVSFVPSAGGGDASVYWCYPTGVERDADDAADEIARADADAHSAAITWRQNI